MPLDIPTRVLGDPDPCFWCRRNLCQSTHEGEIIKYRRRLHNRTLKTLTRLGYSLSGGKIRRVNESETPSPENSQYMAIVADNARRAGKNIEEAVAKARKVRTAGWWY